MHSLSSTWRLMMICSSICLSQILVYEMWSLFVCPLYKISPWQMFSPLPLTVWSSRGAVRVAPRGTRQLIDSADIRREEQLTRDGRKHWMNGFWVQERHNPTVLSLLNRPARNIWRSLSAAPWNDHRRSSQNRHCTSPSLAAPIVLLKPLNVLSFIHSSLSTRTKLFISLTPKPSPAAKSKTFIDWS